MSQANTDPATFAAMRPWCSTDATVGSQQREPVSSNNESYKEISLDNIWINEKEVETRASRSAKNRRHGRFLKGPIPMVLISAAAKLPGQSLALYLAVHHQTALTGKPMVTLPSGLLDEMGIGRDAKARGLRHLENAGLVVVERLRGRSARVGLSVAAASRPSL